MNNLIKNSVITIIISALSNPTSAVEPCTFAHTMAYESASIYDQTQNLGQVGLHLMLETNSLLFRRAKNGGVLNELAKSVSYINNGQTMLVILRENCGWSDGKNITAEEIVFGLKRAFIAGNDLYIPGRNFIKNGPELSDGIVAPNEIGIRVNDNFQIEIDITVGGDLVEQALARANFGPYPLHLSKAKQLEWEQGNLTRLSSGPYQVSSMNETKISMTKNPYYCENIKPQIENIEVLQSQKVSSQIGLWLNKTINVAERFASRDYQVLQMRSKFEGVNNFKVVHMNDEIIEYLTESEFSKMRQYPNLREALFMAIDREQIGAIVENSDIEKPLLSSLSFPYDGYETLSDELFNESYNARITLAKKLMENAGFNKNNRLELSIIVHKGFNDLQIANAIAAMWAQIYVDLKIVDLTEINADEIAEMDKKSDYEITIIGTDYSDPSDLLYSIAVFGKFENASHYAKKVEDSFAIRDQEKRWGELAKIDEKLLRERVALPLAIITTPWILSEDLVLGDMFNLIGSNLTSSTCGNVSP